MNARRSNGKTPLTLALEGKQQDIADLLSVRGATELGEETDNARNREGPCAAIFAPTFAHL